MTRPVLIVGAARSGTKMLRGAIASHPDVAEVPYDVNYVWKWGNYAVPHDELSPERHLDSRRRRFIRSFVLGYARRAGKPIVVEKTVSNTLRLPFVHAVFPEATVVHLVRDGRDVAESARRMWTRPPEWRSIAEKVASVPARALPTYGVQYVASYLAGALRRDRRLTSWGPRFVGIDAATRELPLLVLCGRQWRRCIEATLDAVPYLPSNRVLEVRYETLVQDPARTLAALFRKLALRDAQVHASRAAAAVDATNLGKANATLGADEMRELMDEIGPTLASIEAESP